MLNSIKRLGSLEPNCFFILFKHHRALSYIKLNPQVINFKDAQHFRILQNVRYKLTYLLIADNFKIMRLIKI